MSESEKPQTKSRPPMFRALGNSEPPSVIEVEGIEFTLEKLIKHDSWAATALYAGGERKIVCKFNRKSPIGWVPMGWLGKILARRENRMYDRLSDLRGIAAGYDQVFADGRILENASAHEFIEGHPLRWHDRVHDQFFVRLEKTLKVIHSRGIAYVDMNKSENIIIDSGGNPCLIDFQISLKIPRVWPLSWLLSVLQQCDLYHLDKHARRVRPDLYHAEADEIQRRRPWWIRMHRKIAEPFRAFRRGLLVKLGIRKGKGKAQSEAFVEEGLQEKVATTPTENVAVIQTNQKPILQLYDLLRCAAYQSRTKLEAGNGYEVMFADLCGRPPETAYEVGLVSRLGEATQHYGIVTLLQSKTFYEHSQLWDDDFLLATVARLQSALRATETSPGKHAA